MVKREGKKLKDKKPGTRMTQIGWIFVRGLKYTLIK